MTKAIIFDWFGVCTEDFRKVLGRKLHINKKLIINSYIKYELPLTIKKINSWHVLSGMFKKLKINRNVNKHLHIFKDKPKLNKEIFELAKKLKNKYKTALLSDNFDDMTNTIRKNINLREYFHHVVFSNEVGLVKGYNEIYRFALKKLRCKPSECILIDDKKENIKRARRMGINGILFRNIKQLRRDLNKLDVRF